MRTSVKVLFGCAAVSAVVLVILATVVGGHSVAYGATPTTTGISSLVVSFLSASGFSVAGLLTWAAQHFWPSSKAGQVKDVVELTASFTALMSDKTNHAAQRRFMFAIVDCASLIQGCETSHEGGVIVIKYSGYADPVVVPVVPTA